MELINWDERLLPYRQAVDELTVKINNMKNEYSTLKLVPPMEEIHGRVKSVSSILDKAARRNIAAEDVFDKLEDIAGIRIICRFVEDIERVANIIRQRNGFDMQVIQEEDYVKNPKPGGYRSYHMTIIYNMITIDGPKNIPCEIQIRTLAMNFWASIEHSLRYKYSGNLPDELQDRLKNCADAAFLLDTEMATIRDDIVEAKMISETKNNLVDNIVKNLHNLYYIAKVEKMSAFNRKFIEIYQNGNLEELRDFSQKLQTMARLYKVEYV
ncbi:MAG: GTP pyrophosphokinase family protein [Clostridiales bacterium]|nr:GTP pyrophosphokinase family protein [Clostridiales bacterium]MCD8239486.1 GTP pyrophosphokinase family protein [Clostridiales bacterium]